MPVDMQQGKLRGSNRKMSTSMGPSGTDSGAGHRRPSLDASSWGHVVAISRRSRRRAWSRTTPGPRTGPLKILAQGDIRLPAVDGARRRCSPPARAKIEGPSGHMVPTHLGGAESRPRGCDARDDLTSLRSADLRKKLPSRPSSCWSTASGRTCPVPGVDLDARRPRSTGAAAAARLPQPVRGRRAHPLRGVRAGDHAVHHREHHPAADDGGDPVARGPPEGGRERQQKITQYTRYFTVALALLQSMAYVLYFRSQDALPGFSRGRFYLIVISLTAGTRC